MAVLSIQRDTILFLEIDFSFYVFEQATVASFETIIFVNVLSILMADFPEAVHVQLPDKGREVVVFKESRQYSLRKLTDAFDVKGVVSAGPANDLVDRGVLNELIVTSSMSISF